MFGSEKKKRGRKKAGPPTAGEIAAKNQRAAAKAKTRLQRYNEKYLKVTVTDLETGQPVILEIDKEQLGFDEDRIDQAKWRFKNEWKRKNKLFKERMAKEAGDALRAKVQAEFDANNPQPIKSGARDLQSLTEKQKQEAGSAIASDSEINAKALKDLAKRDLARIADAESIKNLVINEAMFDDEQILSEVDIEIDPSQGSTIAIFGSSKRGKSQLIAYLYKHKFVSYKSEARNSENHKTKKTKSGKKKPTSHYVSTLFADNPQIPLYNLPLLLRSHGFGRAHEKYIMMQHFVQMRTDNQYKFLNMFDDIIDEKHSRIMNKLILSMRNSNVSTIIALQYVKLLSTSNRANINHTFIFGMNQAEDEMRTIDLLLRPYLIQKGIKKKDEQIAFFRLATRDHGFIYLNNLKNRMTLHRLLLKPGKSKL